jgi:hypothetical protein
MKKLLSANLSATKHLLILDEVFRNNYAPYSDWVKRIDQNPFYDELRKEIYAGGKKRRGYARQMILGDLLQYILTGRGYYFAVRGVDEFKAFIEMLMYVSNMCILMEDISVDVNLRNLVLKELSQGLGAEFLEEPAQQEQILKLQLYQGIIARGEGREYEVIFDSILPKRVGIAPELLSYSWLIRKRYGYVIPLLQAQRLLGKGESIIPPDFLLLRSKGEIFGLEVGAGKERQIASFSSITGIPVFTIGIGTVEQPQPYRCDKCLRWITYCPVVISVCRENLDQVGTVHLYCLDCPEFKENLKKAKLECPYMVYYGEAVNYAGEVAMRRYHYQCVKNDSHARDRIEKDTRSLVAPLPTVYGIEHLTEEQ